MPLTLQDKICFLAQKEMQSMKIFSQKKFFKSQNAKKKPCMCGQSFLTRLPLTRLSSDVRITEALTNR